MRILLVEDEPELAVVVKSLLVRENYIVDVVPELSEAKMAILDNDYRLVLLDRNLPDGDGIDLVKYAQTKGLKHKFLILSAYSESDQVVEGLDIGADDYITKPFEPMELLARIRAALRRPTPKSLVRWSCGGLEFHKDSRSATIHGEPAKFARRELSIIEVLIKLKGQVVLRERIESATYGYDDEFRSNTMESHISRIRKRLDRLDAGVKIHVVRGVGYMMKQEP